MINCKNNCPPSVRNCENHKPNRRNDFETPRSHTYKKVKYIKVTPMSITVYRRPAPTNETYLGLTVNET